MRKPTKQKIDQTINQEKLNQWVLDGIIPGRNSHYYWLEKTIGEGDKSDVWLGKDMDNQEPRALKCLKSRAEEDIKKYKDGEIQIINLLSLAQKNRKDGLISTPILFDENVEGQLPVFIVMELMEGNPVDKIAQEEGGLEEEEIIEIGLQICRVLQLLHDQQYSFRDFQTQDLYWEREVKLLKIIDWNVLSEKGKADVPSDNLRIARILFYLRTLVYPPKEGASIRTLDKLGQRRWMGETRRAFRVVLQRALDPTLGFKQTDTFSALQSELQLLTRQEGFGDALRELKRWFTAKTIEIVDIASLCMQEGLEEEALAAVELAEVKKDQYTSTILNKIDQMKKRLSEKKGFDTLSVGKNFMKGQNPDMASEYFHRAVQEYNDLEAQRWLAIADYCQRLPDSLKNELAAESLWEQIIAFMNAEEWDKAFDNLQPLKNKYKPKGREESLNIPFVLEDDIKINRLASEAEELWRNIQAGNIGENLKKLIEKIGIIEGML